MHTHTHTHTHLDPVGGLDGDSCLLLLDERLACKMSAPVRLDVDGRALLKEPVQVAAGLLAAPDGLHTLNAVARVLVVPTCHVATVTCLRQNNASQETHPHA